MRDSPAGEVLFVTSSYPRWHGDATTPFVHHLAQDLRALGWDVHVLAPHAPGAARKEVLDGVPVHRFRYLWPTSLEAVCYDGGALVKLRANRWLLAALPFLVLAQWLAVVGRLWRGRVAIVHSHWLLPQGFTAGLATALLRRPHVATVHGSDVFALSGRIPAFCKRVALRLADAVTVNSNATRQAVLRLLDCEDRLARIPIGATDAAADNVGAVAALRAQYRRGDGPLLVFVGRLVPEKGVSDLLQCVKRLLEPLPGIAALVVGDGPARLALEQEARDLGIVAQVHFLGWLPQIAVRRHLAACDIFIGPSRPADDGTLEAQGLAFAEAMIAGIPVVATAIGGITDTVRHEETGLLVSPCEPGEIADAVRRLVANRSLADRLVSAAGELVREELTREVSARRFSEIYQRVARTEPAQASVREKT